MRGRGVFASYVVGLCELYGVGRGLFCWCAFVLLLLGCEGTRFVCCVYCVRFCWQ